MVTIFAHVLNVISPHECGSCGDGLAFHPLPVCENCVSEILSSEGPVEVTLPLIKKTYSCLEYTPAVKCCIKSFKFSHNRNLFPLFKKVICSHILLSGMRNEKNDIILPVPLHISRRRKRGYNQSELLANMVSTFLALPVYTKLLVKTRNTPAQSGLKKRERSENLKGSFSVQDRPFLMEKSVLLVDDVMTTGATLEECASTLIKAGASSVSAFTLARVIRPL